MVIHQETPTRVRKWLFGGIVAIVIAGYFAAFFFPPRLVGSNDPDRYYHLGLSRLIASEGLPDTLPQVEDLGWGRYFPDKEFLFHAVTGAADWAAGSVGVLLVVPTLAIGIALVLYVALLRVLPPWRAATLVAAALLLSPVLMFRLTLLRPHLLAILFFCLLLAAILRGRAWLVLIASAGFALTYHAFYIPVMVLIVAACFRWPDKDGGARILKWGSAGLLLGIVLNPYFPSTIVMSWVHLKLALGTGLPPGLRSGGELQPISLREWLHYFGFVPVVIIGATVLALARKLRPAPEMAGFWFLFALSGLLSLLSLKSSRATEYAVPSVILLSGYCLALLQRRWGIWLALTALVASQGNAAWIYYLDCWNEPQGGDSPSYLAAVALLPPEADGSKVFNCQWETGPYLLFARPSVRFVDLLEPALLWEASPAKYVARQRLIHGLQPDPFSTLQTVFKADYVLCGSPAMNHQMQGDPEHFQQIRGSEPMNSLRVYRIRHNRDD